MSPWSKVVEWLRRRSQVKLEAERREQHLRRELGRLYRLREARRDF